MALDIEERHLLRLGHGEEELQTEKDFSRSDSYHIPELGVDILKQTIFSRLLITNVWWILILVIPKKSTVLLKL